MLSFGHPRTGLTRLTGDDGHHWPEAFVRDLVAHLEQVEIFDAVWSTVPADRPATVGMRIASLGEGRERAVADLALRLSRELDPAGEPSMASKLPKRWDVDRGCCRPRRRTRSPPPPWARCRPPFVGWRTSPTTGRSGCCPGGSRPTTRACGTVIGELEDRPAELSRLLREAQRTREGAPGIDPIGAAKLDAALGGLVFGDELAKLAEEGDDPASRVGELLESAAERQADGRVGLAARGLAAVRCPARGAGGAGRGGGAARRRRSTLGAARRRTSTARRRSPTRPRGSLGSLWGSRAAARDRRAGDGGAGR